MKNLEMGFTICENRNVADVSGDVEGREWKVYIALYMYIFLFPL